MQYVLCIVNTSPGMSTSITLHYITAVVHRYKSTLSICKLHFSFSPFLSFLWLTGSPLGHHEPVWPRMIYIIKHKALFTSYQPSYNRSLISLPKQQSRTNWESYLSSGVLQSQRPLRADVSFLWLLHHQRGWWWWSAITLTCSQTLSMEIASPFPTQALSKLQRKKWRKRVIAFKLIVWKVSMMGTICPNKLQIELKKKKWERNLI